LNVASSLIVTQTITTADLPTPLVNLAATGIPGSGNAAAFLSQNLINSNGTTIVTLTLTNDATIAAGTYDLAITATGDANFRLPVPVQVVRVWSGANFTGAISTNWASAGNWVGGIVPSSTEAVVFRDAGAHSDGAGPTNVVISANTEVASIRFAPESNTDNNTRAHNFEFFNGAVLDVTGSGLSFSLHRDTKLLGRQIFATFAGQGTLRVANSGAQIGVLVDGQQNATLDMRNLDNFVADVSRIGLGNHRIWPEYYTNGYSGSTGANIQNPPTRFVPLVWLAKTNLVKCSWVDPNNYNDGGIRDYALEIGNDEAAGTTANIRFTLGNSNAFFLDSICWSHSGKGGGGNTYNFNATNSYAVFRGIGGGRMSVWAQGDASGVGPSGSNVRGNTVDFGNGQVDALIDRLLIGRSRTNTTGMTIQGTLTIGGAFPSTVFDVNTAVLGQQDFDNIGTGAGTVSGPTGTVNVNSNATLRVNSNLHLGYTVATANGLPTYPENCGGTLNINNGGMVLASNIVAGGITKLSINNTISVNNSGKLVVTNKIGAADAPINLTLANNAQVTLMGVQIGQTAIHAKTFAAATPCSILVPAIAGYVSGTVTIPVITYVTASPNIAGLTVTPPAGLFTISVVDNGAGTINVTFGDRIPQTLVWRGNISSDWNVTDKNWVTQTGGIQTNFFDGDSVIFDDTVGAGPTTITISSPVAPGQVIAPYGIVVSNANYTFDSGSVLGAATLRKTGTGTLTVNASLSPGILLNQGTLAGSASGVVGPTKLEAGTTMTSFAGTINGGLTASNATVTVTGTVNGGINLQAGSLNNQNIINGTPTLATNVTLINLVGANMNVTVPWSVPTNSVLINNGRITQSGPTGQNQGLTVSGQLRGIGVISLGSGNSADARVTLSGGGDLTIGNSANEITNVTIAVRLDLLADSTTTFDVDNSSGLNDKIHLTDGFIQGKVNFGAGNGLGGYLAINKISGPAFNFLTSLQLFDITANIPDNVAQAIPRVYPQPGPGLVWDVSRTVSNLTLVVQGPTFITNSITTGTNGVKSLVFDWPENYRGWRLERQTNTLAVGLELNSTNWITVATSLGGSNTTFYPDTNDLSIRFFRSTQAVTDTNGAGLYPATFFRLNYP
jgi:hypothetical protein